MRAIGLIIIRKDFDEVNQLLKCIFIVSMNEEKCLDMNKELTPCENVENYFKKSIANNKVVTVVEDFNDSSADITDEILDSGNILKKYISSNVFDKI